MGRKVISTCDMCGATKNGDMCEIDIYNYYDDSPWDVPIPEIFLCDDCLSAFLQECHVDMHEVEREYNTKQAAKNPLYYDIDIQPEQLYRVPITRNDVIDSVRVIGGTAGDTDGDRPLTELTD